MGTSWKGELRIDIPGTQNTLNVKGSLHPVSKSMARVKRVNTKTVCPSCASEKDDPSEVPTLSQKIVCPECGEEYSWWGEGIKGVKENGEIVAVLSDEEMDEISEEKSVFMDLLFITTMEEIENTNRIAHEGKRYVFAPRGKKDKLEEATRFYQYIAEQISDRYGVCKLKQSATKETLLGFTSEYREELGYVLVFEQLAFNEDINDLPKYLKETDWKELDEEEREYSEKLISKLTEMNPDWEEVRPEIAEEMRDLVEQKIETGKIEVEIPEPEEETEEAKEKGKEKLKALVE